MTEEMVITRLSSQHDRSPFDCGNEPLNTWLKIFANQYAKRDLAVTYALVREANQVVLGYYSLSCHAVNVTDFPADQAKGLPNIAVPVALLGRFAVDLSQQGKGYGRRLLLDALHRCSELASQIGLRVIEVDAIDDRAREYYRRHDFISFPDDENHLFIPMKIVRSIFPK